MSVALVRMSDASTPPDKLPKGTRAVAGYIGGDTPHIWTREEWQKYGRLKKLPIWVNDGDKGEEQAFDALMALFDLQVPKGSPVVFDVEAAKEIKPVHEFAEVVNWCGYKVWVYGSKDTLFDNPPCNGYWVADYTGQPHIYPHPKVRATQYAANVNGQDLNDVTDWAYAEQMRTW